MKLKMRITAICSAVIMAASLMSFAGGASPASWKYGQTTYNYDIRTHAIDTITIHHMAGNGSLEGCCGSLDMNGASVNYCIDSNGKIGVMIDEQYRAWTSGSVENDMRAVTMEVANDMPSDEGGWHVSDQALESIIELCTDICRRNGKTAMIWCGSYEATLARQFASNEMRMTIHEWVGTEPTGCPGPYLKSKMGYIASEVTRRLGGRASDQSLATSSDNSLDAIADEVCSGKWGAGVERTQRLIDAGYDPNEVQAIVNSKYFS